MYNQIIESINEIKVICDLVTEEIGGLGYKLAFNYGRLPHLKGTLSDVDACMLIDDNFDPLSMSTWDSTDSNEKRTIFKKQFGRLMVEVYATQIEFEYIKAKNHCEVQDFLLSYPLVIERAAEIKKTERIATEVCFIKALGINVSKTQAFVYFMNPDNMSRLEELASRV